jgi:hypothetical protein
MTRIDTAFRFRPPRLAVVSDRIVAVPSQFREHRVTTRRERKLQENWCQTPYIETTTALRRQVWREDRGAAMLGRRDPPGGPHGVWRGHGQGPRMARTGGGSPCLAVTPVQEPGPTMGGTRFQHGCRRWFGRRRGRFAVVEWRLRDAREKEASWMTGA